MNAKQQKPMQKPANENKWRESITSENVSLIAGLIEAEGKEGLARAAEVVNLTPYRTAPRFAVDNALNEKAFSTGDLQHHIGFLLADDRDIDKMRSRLEWLVECRGKLAWMQAKLADATEPSTIAAKIGQKTLEAQNRVMMAKFKLRDAGSNADTVNELTLALEQAKDHLRTVLKTARAAVLEENEVFATKVEGLQKAIDTVGDVDAAIERLDQAGMVIAAKRTLAAMIQPILDARLSELAEKETAAAEVEAIIASVVPETAVAVAMKKGKKVKGPAVSRGEVTAKSLTDLEVALVHKQVAEVSAKRVSKAEAIEAAGVPAEVFEMAAMKAEIGEEEEVLTNTATKAVVLVRRVGNTRRFFVKQA